MGLLMIYILATFIYLLFAITSFSLKNNLVDNPNAEEKVTGCMSCIAIFCIIAFEIWLMAHGLLHLGVPL